MRSHRVFSCVCALGALAGLVGCSTTVVAPPPELAEARAAYAKAANGPAAQFAPAQLHEARTSLERAEVFYRHEPTAAGTRAQAYIAARRAQTAEADANTKVALIIRDRAQRVALETQAQALANTRADLERTREQLAMAQTELGEAQSTQREAELRALHALAALERQGRVHDDARGKVIALPGGVLFAKGQAQLLPAATHYLDDVAQAVRELPSRRIRVEGFTDNTGGDALNIRLSEQRAQAVRAYLVGHGVEGARITSVGLGPSQPVADNATPDGRAANRRVEIVIQPPTGAAEQMPKDKDKKDKDNK